MAKVGKIEIHNLFIHTEIILLQVGTGKNGDAPLPQIAAFLKPNVSNILDIVIKIIWYV